MIPTAELHVHLEGTLTPQKTAELARKNNMPIPKGIISPDGASYTWQAGNDAGETLMAFVKTYDRATSVIKTDEDYYDITFDYLSRCAREGSLYEELTIYADPEPFVGLSFNVMINAIADAIDAARDQYGIESRMLPAFVRHCGPDQAMKDAVTVTENPHPYVTGITMAGAETAYTVDDFVPAYRHVTEKLHLPKTAHAGEATGPETIRACYEKLGITRFGHMVRIVEDPALMAEMAEIGAVAEVCPSSNIALGVYPDFESHPLQQMRKAGLNITLNSDDPPFFNTTLRTEYDIARDHFGFDDTDLITCTRNAIKSAFIDDNTRVQLLTNLGTY